MNRYNLILEENMQHTQEELLAILDENKITYVNHEHPAVYTVEEAALHLEGIDGVPCKNLFLKDKKKNCYLVVTLANKPIVIKDVARKIGAKPLSFGKPDLLMDVLGVTPGAVTPFGAINKSDRSLKVVLDQEMMDCKLLSFHPLVNTATTSISSPEFTRFMQISGVDFEVTWL